jgi:type III secretion system YscI/HrpB-like protein
MEITMSSPVGPVTPSPPVYEAPNPEPIEGKFAQRLRALEQSQAAALPPPALVAVKHFFEDMESGQASLDALVNAATSGKKFSNAELLGLQAAMSRYTLEIDLVSKIVQQAVAGLKDLLKMQV